MKGRIGSRAVKWMVVAVMYALPVQGFALTVNTADIANGAVTTDKIANGAVTASKLGIACSSGEYLQYVFGSGWVCSVGTAGPVGPQGPVGATGPQGPAGIFEIPDGSITSTKLATGSVTSIAIADGTVTDEKISAVSSLKLTGTISPDKLAAYAGIKLVHKGAADNVSTFNSISAAINYISQNSNSYTGERQAILVMPGTYAEDFSTLDGDVTFNIDIIGTSRTGTIIIPIASSYLEQKGTFISHFAMNIPSGMYLRNLTLTGIVYIEQSKNSGVIGIDVIAAGKNTNYIVNDSWIVSAGFNGGGSNMKNFTIEDVYIEPPVGYSAILLYGTVENDTFIFNNIRIKAGSIDFIYPESKPCTFTNISFSGGSSGQQLFSLRARGANFNFNNIITDGSYGYGFSIAEVGIINVMNSTINISNKLFINGGNNTMSIMNSDISTASLDGPSNFVSIRIGNSRIGTLVPSGQAIKLVNSFDGNFEPYVNGLY